MNLTIKNYELKPIGDFLYGLSLKGKDSRMRSRFVALLEQQLNLINKERNLLLEDYGQKDEEGKLKTDTDENGQSFIVLEDSSGFNSEVAKLMNEDFIVETTPDKVEMLKSVQRVVLDCDIEFSGVEAVRYNRFCDILEAIVF